jgi:DNA-binding MarR family transcriptional regulator
MSFDTRLLNGLNVLAAIVEAGNFVRAGEALGLTQSGVSRAMQRLEQQLGVRLLDRTPKAVTLTNEGKQFYQEVAPLLAGLEAAAIDAGQSATTVRGRLRVNVDPTFARLILARHLGRFLKTHFGLSLGISSRKKDNHGPSQRPFGVKRCCDPAWTLRRRMRRRSSIRAGSRIDVGERDSGESFSRLDG